MHEQNTILELAFSIGRSRVKVVAASGQDAPVRAPSLSPPGAPSAEDES
jgi:hypothetical protein